MTEVTKATQLIPQIQAAIDKKEVQKLGIYSSATTVINKVSTRVLTTVWSIVWNAITLPALIATFIKCLSWLGAFCVPIAWIGAIGLIVFYVIFEANYIHSIIKSKKITNLLCKAQEKGNTLSEKEIRFLNKVQKELDRNNSIGGFWDIFCSSIFRAITNLLNNRILRREALA